MPIYLSRNKPPLGHYLWKVENCNATLYLLGTIHILPEKAFPLHPEIMSAFHDCKNLVCEVDIVNDNPSTLTISDQLLSDPRYTYPPGDSLYNHFNRSHIRKLRDYVVDANVCSETLANKFYKLKPDVIATMLNDAVLKKGGVNPSCMGIDCFLLQEAKKLDKTILELETREQQERLLKELYPDEDCDTSPPTTSTKMTSRKVLKDLDRASHKTRKFVRRVFALYPHIHRFSRLVPPDHPLTGDRNTAMCQKIEGYLTTSSSYFVAVGAMHLNGEGSIIELLTQKGYTLKKIL